MSTGIVAERSHKYRHSRRLFKLTMVAAVILAALMSPVSLIRAVRAAPGGPDLSFGQDGNVFLPSHPAKLAIQADGKIVVASKHLLSNVLVVDRYLPSGELDWRRIVLPTSTGPAISVHKVLIRSDAKILVAYRSGRTSRVVLLRQNGLVDSTFGSDGKVRVSFEDVEVMSDSRLITLDSNVTVDFHPPYPIEQRHFFFQVRDANGELLQTVSLNYPTPPDTGLGRLAVDPDGRLMVASTSLLTRYNADLTLDSGFCGGGTCSSPFWPIHHLMVANDGKIIIAMWGFWVARLLPNGEVDTGFGPSGFFGISPFRPYARFARVTVDDTGRILVAENDQSDSLITVINAKGSTAEHFTQGPPILDFAPQADGKLVVSGSNILENNDGGVLTRYHYTDERKKADLRFTQTKITAKTGVNRGDEIEYAISVVNDGPDKAGHLTFENPLPHGTSFVSFEAPPGWFIYQLPAIFGVGKISCSRFGLASGKMETLHLTVRVRGNAPQGAQVINTSSINSLVTDPVQSNNTTTATVTVP